MSFLVTLVQEAQDDIERLFEFALQRELISPSGDVSKAHRAAESIYDGIKLLERYPFTCRKAAQGRLGPLHRELVIPSGSSGYVALFEILDGERVLVTAIPQQREDDYR